MGQKVFFDPCVPYKFRISKCAFGERPDFSQPDYQTNSQVTTDVDGANEINMFSIMRVKKVIADYMMREHISLFTNQKTHADAIQQKIIVSRADILKNYSILSKTKSEIRMSAEPDKDPHTLVEEVVQELWERGFLVKISPDGDSDHVFRIQDLTEKLARFIIGRLKEEGQPTHFTTINEWVTRAEGGFFKKEFVFTVMDRLHQQGQILETEN